jgi:hypothetical protein
MPEQPSLAGPRSRIDRADEVIPELEAGLRAFLQSDPYTIEEHPDDNPAARAFVITSLTNVPFSYTSTLPRAERGPPPVAPDQSAPTER